LTSVKKPPGPSPTSTRLVALARLLLGAPGGVLARAALDVLDWGSDPRGKQRKTLLKLEQAGILRREADLIYVIDRDALVDLMLGESGVESQCAPPPQS
jgi:hypothetical protein